RAPPRTAPRTWRRGRRPPRSRHSDCPPFPPPVLIGFARRAPAIMVHGPRRRNTTGSCKRGEARGPAHGPAKQLRSGFAEGDEEGAERDGDEAERVAPRTPPSRDLDQPESRESAEARDEVRLREQAHVAGPSVWREVGKRTDRVEIVHRHRDA